jgi:hypothetical protein
VGTRRLDLAQEGDAAHPWDVPAAQGRRAAFSASKYFTDLEDLAFCTLG